MSTLLSFVVMKFVVMTNPGWYHNKYRFSMYEIIIKDTKQSWKLWYRMYKSMIVRLSSLMIQATCLCLGSFELGYMNYLP